MISNKNIEALIITSNVKYNPEFNKNIIASSVETKNDYFISNIINNIKQNSNINNFLITHDLKIDNKDSLIYQDRLEDICKKEGLRLIVSPSSIKMPSQISATVAFKNGLKKINKEYFLFWEHDHFFTKKIDWQLISDCFFNGGKMIRFNRKINKKNKAFKINKRIIDNFEIINNTEFNSKILSTNLYSNGPFISEKKFCETLWNNVVFDYPSWNGHFGGFIEGPVNQKMLFDQFNMSKKDFMNKYPIFLYGGDEDLPIVQHKGRYTPQYQIKNLSFESLILIIKFLKQKIKKFWR